MGIMTSLSEKAEGSGPDRAKEEARATEKKPMKMARMGVNVL